MYSRKNLIIGISAVALILLCVLGYLFFTGQLTMYKGVTHSVLLTQDGFNPQNLTIKRGDTVVFSSNVNEPYWPASNPHPIHSDYPEFDPRRPIQQGETWSYTFTKVGTWGFHNHLNSPTQGVITVIP